MEATVALDRARRDLANTVLRAPIAGIATQVTSIQMGRYLTAGMAVFSIIGTDTVWVDANPKETDLTYVRPGQPVTITVDAFPVPGVARHRRRHQPRHRRAVHHPAAAERGRQLDQDRAARAAAGSSSSRARICSRLRSGMSADVEIDTGRRGRMARLFGSSAVAQDPDP